MKWAIEQSVGKTIDSSRLQVTGWHSFVLVSRCISADTLHESDPHFLHTPKKSESNEIENNENCPGTLIAPKSSNKLP